MSRIVGIDLGTTNSLVAAVDAGIPYVIAGTDGQRLTPSAVNFPREGAAIVGRAAQRLRAIVLTERARQQTNGAIGDETVAIAESCRRARVESQLVPILASFGG